MCWKCSKTTQNIMKLARLKSLRVTLGISHWTLIIIQLMTSKKTNLKRTKRTGKKGNTWFERISRKWGKRRFCWWVERAVKSKKKKKKKGKMPKRTFTIRWNVGDTKRTAQTTWRIRKAISSFSIWNIGKAAAERGCRKTKVYRFFLEFGKILGQVNNN